MTFKMEQELSIMAQSLATTSLLAKLNNEKFLESEYFKSMNFDNQAFKDILLMSGIGNPATMQMMLYALLIIPFEILSKKQGKELKRRMKIINNKFYDIVEVDKTFSTYDGEKSKSKINYVKHIRNSVVHCTCVFDTCFGKNYVVFKDNDKKGHKCSIKIECVKIGIVLMELQRVIMQYCNDINPSLKRDNK